MTSLQSLVSKYEKLRAAWEKKNLSECGKLLAEFKVDLAKSSSGAGFLPTEDADSAKKELLVARNVLEIGAKYAVECEDIAAFDRYMSQLQTYYTDYADVLEESPYKYELMGLNLLCLLALSRNAEFHVSVEKLPVDVLQKNHYIRHPVQLEQFIMEGNYNKVILMKDNVPSKSYTFFINLLLQTIRSEIASCMEKAYEQISLKDCAKMLQLDSKDANKLIKERGWTVKGTGAKAVVEFEGGESEGKAGQPGEEVPTEELAKMSITYAREMEQIV